MDQLIRWSRKRGNSTISDAATVGGGNDSEQIEEQRQLQEPAIVGQVAEVPSVVEDQASRLQLPFDDNRIPVTLEGPHKGIPGFSRGSTVDHRPVLLKRPCLAYRKLDRENMVWRDVPLHKHILEFLGACKVTRQWYYVVPYLPNLSPMLVHLHTNPDADRGTLVCNSGISIAGGTRGSDIIRQVLQVCDALKTLHLHKIVHGNVGITHLLVSDRGPLLYDFCKSRTHQAKGFEEDVFDLGITIAEILKGKRYNHRKIRLFGTYPRQPPWNSSIRALYDQVWNIATYCWSPNPSFRPTVPEAFESLSKSLGPVRVAEPPMSGFDVVLSDRTPPEEFRGSASTRPVPPSEPQTQLTTPNQLVLPPSVPPSLIPERLIPAQDANGGWIECAPDELFNLPVRRYRKIEGIPQASGGFSDVWKCETFYSDGSHQLVAEKVLRAAHLSETETIYFKCMKQLMREVTIWGNLRHPRIAPLMGFTFQPSIALISPWYKNGNFPHYLQSLQAQNQDCDRLKLLHEIAQGLTYLHEFKPPVVHGDIKPVEHFCLLTQSVRRPTNDASVKLQDNILIDDNGSALIIDFGLSRSVVESIPGCISSNRGAGNARWMAPELIEGGVPKSRQGDVYSFASLALNILTEEIPFSNFTNEVTLILALASESPPSPASTQQELRCNPALETHVWKLLDECWATNPAERPTMRDVEGRIQKLGGLDDALAEANGVNNPLPPTENEDKGSAPKDKGQCDQHDILPETENQAPDEKPPPVAPPSSSFLGSLNGFWKKASPAFRSTSNLFSNLYSQFACM